jgi:hypothetical protein
MFYQTLHKFSTSLDMVSYMHLNNNNLASSITFMAISIIFFPFSRTSYEHSFNNFFSFLTFYLEHVKDYSFLRFSSFTTIRNFIEWNNKLDNFKFMNTSMDVCEMTLGWSNMYSSTNKYHIHFSHLSFLEITLIDLLYL